MPQTSERKDRGTEKEVHDLTKREEVSSVIDQSIRSLHEMERRLVAMEAEFARITGRMPAASRLGAGAEHITSQSLQGGQGHAQSLAGLQGTGFPGAAFASPFGQPSALQQGTGFPGAAFASPFGQPSALQQNAAFPNAAFASPYGPAFHAPAWSRLAPPMGFGPSPFMAGAFNAGAAHASPAGSQQVLGSGAESLLGALGGSFGESGMTRTRDLADMPPQVRQPSMDVLDEGKEFIIHVELPGVRKEDLDIMVTERALVLNAKMRPESDKGVVVHSERPPVLYRRNVMLGAEVDTTNAKANLKDGILTVRVPKSTPSNGPRQLDVAYG